ncbi:MAG: chorismate mutase, partial [Gammaproteobacteria bacterium]|nr:chorismate mutase [Gammaproteobacteria bacterium]
MELEQLRDQLSAIDRKILELVAERQRLSGEIGAWKRASGRPTRDFAREKKVLDKARSLAAGLGIPTGLVESLFSLLIQ